MKKINLKAIVPYGVAIIAFLMITIIYLSPLLEGKRIWQSDIAQHLGASKEIAAFRAKTGQEALEVEPHVALGSRLTPSVFGPVHAFGDQFKGCGIRNVDRGCASGRSDPAGQRQNRAAIWNSDFSPRRSGGGVICCVENLSA